MAPSEFQTSGGKARKESGSGSKVAPSVEVEAAGKLEKEKGQRVVSASLESQVHSDASKWGEAKIDSLEMGFKRSGPSPAPALAPADPPAPAPAQPVAAEVAGAPSGDAEFESKVQHLMDTYGLSRASCQTALVESEGDVEAAVPLAFHYMDVEGGGVAEGEGEVLAVFAAEPKEENAKTNEWETAVSSDDSSSDSDSERQALVVARILDLEKKIVALEAVSPLRGDDNAANADSVEGLQGVVPSAFSDLLMIPLDAKRIAVEEEEARANAEAAEDGAAQPQAETDKAVAARLAEASRAKAASDARLSLAEEELKAHVQRLRS